MKVISRYGNIHVQVFAVNDAGVGPSATITIPFGNAAKEQGKIPQECNYCIILC